MTTECTVGSGVRFGPHGADSPKRRAISTVVARRPAASRRAIARRIAGSLLVIAGLLLAAAATRARAFAAALPDLLDDAPASLGHDVGSDAAFEPFTFAVVGAPRGDAAALERALKEIAETTDARVTVIMGDVLSDDTSQQVPLADVLSRHWRGMVLLAGPKDADIKIANALVAARIRPAERWIFLESGCLFRGNTSPLDGGPVTGLGDPTIVFDFAASTTAAGTTARSPRFAPPSGDDGRLHYELVDVRSAGDIHRTPGSVARGPSLASSGRDIALRVLWPAVDSVPGVTAAWITALALATVGLLLAWRRENDAHAPGTSPACAVQRRA